MSGIFAVPMTIGGTTGTQTAGTETVLSALEQGAPIQSPVDLHPALESIRNMPEFQPPKPGLMDELLKLPLVKELTRQLDKFMEETVMAVSRFLAKLQPPGLATMPDSIRDVFSGFVGFILVLLGLYAFYILLGWLLRSQEQKNPDNLPIARVLEQVRLVSSSYHSQKAQELAQSGEYSTAVRQLYFALLCLLDEKALVRFEATRSNREYEHSLSQLAAEGIVTDFAKLAGRFEATHYGRQPVSGEQFAQCEQAYRHIAQQTVVGSGKDE